nr:MAG TPA: hypothetical protein [Caudoviricetes sp.]
MIFRKQKYRQSHWNSSNALTRKMMCTITL